MMNNYFSFSLGLLLLAGCAKNDSSPQPSLTGQVQLVDETGLSQANGAGVEVTVTDVSPQATTQTLSDGTYHFDNLPAGSHRLSFTKSGYGTFQLALATTAAAQATKAPDLKLAQVPTVSLGLNIIQQVGPLTNRRYAITGFLAPLPTANLARPYRLFLQANDGSTAIRQPINATYDLTLAGTTRPDGTFTDTVTLKQLTDARIGNLLTRVLVWGAVDVPAATTYTEGSTLVYPAAVPVLANSKQFYIYP